MSELSSLLEQNKNWAKTKNKTFFKNLAAGQSPQYLYFGCSDSRVVPNEILGTKPGDLFVHRNIGNVISQNDLNGLSVLQYAIEALNIKEIIVCGHYECGGVKAACTHESHGAMDPWIDNLRDVKQKHSVLLDKETDKNAQHKRLCELNVLEQINNLNETQVIKNARNKNKDITIHGIIFNFENGLIKNLTSANT